MAPELAPAALAVAASVQATTYPLKLGIPSAPVRSSAPRATPVRSSAPRASGTQAISKHSQRMKCIADWKDLLEQVGTCSAMCVAIASKSPEAAYEASLRDFAPSTLAQYFRCVRVFLPFARALDVLIGDLPMVRIVDLMHACDTSHTEDRTSVRISPKPMLKVARIGQIHSLTAPLANQLVRAFASPQQNQKRKEALPLPLAVLAESLFSRLHDRPTHRIRFLPLGGTHQHALRGHPAHPRARHQPDSACLARFMLGNQNN